MATLAKKVIVDAVAGGGEWEVLNPPAPRKIHPRQLPLDSLERVRREMARVYREARGGLLPTAEMTKFVYALGEIGKMLTLAQIEQRLTVLESGAALPPPQEDDHGDES